MHFHLLLYLLLACFTRQTISSPPVSPKNERAPQYDPGSGRSPTEPHRRTFETQARFASLQVGSGALSHMPPPPPQTVSGHNQAADGSLPGLGQTGADAADLGSSNSLPRTAGLGKRPHGPEVDANGRIQGTLRATSFGKLNNLKEKDAGQPVAEKKREKSGQRKVLKLPTSRPDSGAASQPPGSTDRGEAGPSHGRFSRHDAAGTSDSQTQKKKVRKAESAKAQVVGDLDLFNRDVLTRELLQRPHESFLQYNARVCPLLRQHARHVFEGIIAEERLHQVRQGCQRGGEGTLPQHQEALGLLHGMAGSIRGKGAADQATVQAQSRMMGSIGAFVPEVAQRRSGETEEQHHERANKALMDELGAWEETRTQQAAGREHDRDFRKAAESLMMMAGESGRGHSQ